MSGKLMIGSKMNGANGAKTKKISTFESSILFKFSLGFAALALTAGCSGGGSGLFGGQQDPYEDKADNIRNATPPRNEKTQLTLEEQLLKLDTASEIIYFREGVEGQATFLPKVLKANIKYKMVVANQKEFPQSNFDSSKGVFTWTPPNGYTEDAPKKENDFQIDIVTEATDKIPSLSRRFTYKVIVEKNITKPEIMRFEISSTIKQNETGILKVWVKDLSATSTEGTRPKLVFANSESSDVVYMVSIKKTTTLNPTRTSIPLPAKDPVDGTWYFEVEVSVKEVLGNSYAKPFSVLFSAYNYFGIASEQRASVQTRALVAPISPSISLPAVERNVKPGEQVKTQFQLYIPTNRGVLSLNSIDTSQLPGVSLLSCKPSGILSTLNCDFQWAVPEDILVDQFFAVEFKVDSRTVDPIDTAVISKIFKMAFSTRNSGGNP